MTWLLWYVVGQAAILAQEKGVLEVEVRQGEWRTGDNTIIATWWGRTYGDGYFDLIALAGRKPWRKSPKAHTWRRVKP